MDDSECRTNVALDLIVSGQKVVDLSRKLVLKCIGLSDLAKT